MIPKRLGTPTLFPLIEMQQTKISDLENPTHSFENSGTYNVVLTAFSKNGSKSDKATASINIIDQPWKQIGEDIDGKATGHFFGCSVFCC